MPGLTIKTVFQAINKMTQPISTMQSQVGKFASAANRATAGIGAGFGRLRGIIAGAIGGLSVAAALKGITNFAAKGDDILDVANRLGLTAEALQEFQYAAKMADLTAEELTGVMQKMNTNLGQLKVGQGSLFQVLSKTNPQLARQLRNVKNSDEAFSLLMDSIAKETNVQKRATLAQAAFGKSGQALIDMAGDLNEKRKEARAAGAIISNEDILAAQRMHNSLLRLKASWAGFLNNVLGRVAQVLAPILEKWSAWVVANRELIGQRIDAVIGGIGGAIKFLVPFLKAAVDLFIFLKPILPIVIAGIVGLTVAQWALNVAMDANPIGAVILALTALVAVIIVVIRYWKEITAFLTSAWNKINEIFNNPAVKIALMFIAQPLLIILGAIQGIVDLLSGRGIGQALSNLLGPYKMLTDAMGLTKAGGKIGTPVSPNTGTVAAAARPGLDWKGSLEIAGAPPGSKYTGGGTGAPAVTLNLGSSLRGINQ